jgi:hypothetical protein
VTVEAQTAKFAAQMQGLKQKAGEAGEAIGGTDFGGMGERLAAIFEALPGRLAAAMAPVGGKIASTLQKSFKPLDKVQATLTRLGGTLAHAFRFDLIHQGLATTRSLVNLFFQNATGGAAALGVSLKAALSLATLGNNLQRLQARIVSLVTPSKVLARTILASAGVGMALSQKALGALFSKATGRTAALGHALAHALDFGRMAAKSKFVVDALARMIKRATNLTGAIHAVGSAVARVAHSVVTLTGKFTGAHKAAGGLKGVLGEIAVAAGLAAVGYKIYDFFRRAVDGASHLAETMDKINVVMGDAAPAAIRFSNQVARSFGLVKTSTLDALSGFAGLAKGLGKLQGKDLSDFSIRMTKLAMDFSSLGDMDFDVAEKSLKIGLTGEPSDVLKQFGVIVLESTVLQEALAMKMKLVNGQLTQQQKLMARASLIERGLHDAEGNLEATIGSTANQIRKASGQWENFATVVGAAVLPFVNKAIGMFSDLTEFLTGSFERNKAAFDGFMKKLIVGLSVIQSFVKNAGKMFTLFGLLANQAWADVATNLEILRTNFNRISIWIGQCFQKLWAEVGRMARVFFENLALNAKNAAMALALMLLNPFADFEFDWHPMTDSFKLALDKMPPLLRAKIEGMSPEARKLWDEVMGDVDWDPKVKENIPGQKRDGVDMPDQVKAAEGKHSGIEEFLKSLQEAVGGGNMEARQVKAAETAAAELKRLNQLLEGKNLGNPGAGGPAWEMEGMA